MLKTIGKYEIVRLLGKGSMGEVYLGLDPVLGREVAIKTIQSGTAFDSEGEARFTREARAMAALNHPHIVTIFDFGTVEQTHYLAMEYLQGEDLASLIHFGAHSKLELLEALAQACEGLGYAHDHGIIHRDVKPGNILVATGGRRLLAKLLDFGVASVDRSSLTEQGVWMGTVSYMAPEYLDTGKSTPSADLFAVGVIIYEILAGGRKPFQGEGTTAILNAILRKPADPLTPEDLAGVPAQVLAVMDKALAKEPQDRYASADELASALREALASPVPAVAEEPRPQVVVGKGGTCLSLRVALRQAQPGATITVLPGIYREALRVDKSLTFQGEGDPADIVLEAPSGSSLTVDAPACVFRGLTFLAKTGETAVELRSGKALLEICSVQNLHLASGAEATLEACAVTGPGSLPALRVATGASLRALRGSVSNPLGLGLQLGPGARFSGEDLRFEDTLTGAVELGSDSRSSFLRCSFLRSRFAGVLAFAGAEADLQDCLLSGHEGAGLHAVGAKIQLASCRLVGNAGLGLSVVDGGQARLSDCDLSGNGQPGLLLHRGGGAQLSRCQVVDGQSLGIACHQDAALAMAGSTLRGNLLGGILLGSGAQAPDLSEDNRLEDAILR